MIAFVRSIPGGFDGLWQVFIDLLTLVAAGLVVASAVRRRWSVLRDLLLAVVVAVSPGVDRAVHGSWASVWTSLRGIEPTVWFPPLRLTITAVVVMAAAPHLTQPVRRVGRRFVVFGAASTVLLGLATPISVGAGLLVAAMGAAAVHLLFGSSGGHPSLAEVEAALESLGVHVRSLGAAQRQRTGMFLVDAVDDTGGDLVVNVRGRDASDIQLLTTAWRTVWYREAGAPRSFAPALELRGERGPPRSSTRPR